MVGGIIMAHGDDAGLRLPPKLAPVQARLLLVADQTNAAWNWGKSTRMPMPVSTFVAHGNDAALRLAGCACPAWTGLVHGVLHQDLGGHSAAA